MNFKVKPSYLFSECSSSAMELGQVSQRSELEDNSNLVEKPMHLNLNNQIQTDSDCPPSTHSSQYYSALDVFHGSTMTVTSRDVLNDIASPITEISTLNIADADDDNHSLKSDSTLPGDGTFLETISIKTIDSDCSAASSCHPDRTLVGDDDSGIRRGGEEGDNVEGEEDSLFDGRASLFDEHRTNYHGYNVIERTSTFQPYKPKLLHRGMSVESNDDDITQVTQETELWGWGKNSYGQLGIGGFSDW